MDLIYNEIFNYYKLFKRVFVVLTYYEYIEPINAAHSGRIWIH